MNLLGPTSISAIYTAEGKKRLKKEPLGGYTVNKPLFTIIIIVIITTTWKGPHQMS